MLRASPWLLAHQVRPPGPHELWTAWHLHPLVVLGLAVAAAAFVRHCARGRRPDEAWLRAGAGAAGLATLALALLSPVDALARALASAHMVQHVMLTMVAAPLLALGAPLTTVSLPSAARRPVVTWLLHVAALWVWHSAVLYDAAVRDPLLHGLEHLTFIATGVLFWHTVLGGRGRQVSPGTGVMLVFTMALQGVILSALLTFAPSPWYGAYTATRTWGLDPLTDQQLAGVIMWITGGLIHLGVALALLAAWIREGDATAPVPERRERVA